MNPPCARAPGSFAEVAARVAPSLVTFFGPEGEGGGPYATIPLLLGGSTLPLPEQRQEAENEVPLGSGFVLDDQGTIISSLRVASDAPYRTVRLADGRRLRATLRGSDPDLDVALYSLPEPFAAAIAPADSSRQRQGDWVSVVSDPFGTGPAVVVGVIRHVRFGSGDQQSERATSPEPIERMMAIDATTDAATWGGAVVDTAGRLVGLSVAASSSGSRMSLVLPTNEIRRVASLLLADGHSSRSWIGLWVRALDADRARELGSRGTSGLLVTRTVSGGPADEAGIVPQDIIVEFAGEQVGSPAQIASLASRVEAGQSLPVLVFRDGRSRTVRLQPGVTPH